MLNVNFSQLDIVGSALISGGVTAVAPSGYDFVMIIPAVTQSTTINLKFSVLEPSPGTLFFGTNTPGALTGTTAGTTGGPTAGYGGTTGNNTNFGLATNGGPALVGRWKVIRPETLAVIAYLAR
jgi:hypothetical protein